MGTLVDARLWADYLAGRGGRAKARKDCPTLTPLSAITRIRQVGSQGASATFWVSIAMLVGAQALLVGGWL
jgi:hypothetical protein